MASIDEIDSWLKLGRLIVNMYDHFVSIDDAQAISYGFTVADLLIASEDDASKNGNCASVDVNGDCDDGGGGGGGGAGNEAIDARSDIDDSKPEDKENSNSNTDSGKFAIPTTDVYSADASAEDSDVNKDGAGDAPSKPKNSRRRGSGLQFLEQWCFWDRNRKYSQRRRNQQSDRPEVDNSIRGALRKILPKYFE